MDRDLCNDLRKLDTIQQPKDYVCEECVKTGSRWMHLRTCQTCGATLCCDSSPNKHASKHAVQEQHPVAISAERGERWAWCYVHQQIKDY